MVTVKQFARPPGRFQDWEVCRAGRRIGRVIRLRTRFTAMLVDGKERHRSQPVTTCAMAVRWIELHARRA